MARAPLRKSKARSLVAPECQITSVDRIVTNEELLRVYAPSVTGIVIEAGG